MAWLQRVNMDSKNYVGIVHSQAFHRNILLSSTSGTDSASTDDNIANSSISSSVSDDDSHDETFEFPGRQPPQLLLERFSFPVPALGYKQQVSSAIKIQQTYRGHLGREIVRWLIIEIQSDKNYKDMLCSSPDRDGNSSFRCGVEVFPQPMFKDRNKVFEKLTLFAYPNSPSCDSPALVPCTCENLFERQKIASPKVFEGTTSLKHESKGLKISNCKPLANNSSANINFRSHSVSMAGGSIALEIVVARMLRHRAIGKPPNPFCRLSLHQSCRARGPPVDRRHQHFAALCEGYACLAASAQHCQRHGHHRPGLGRFYRPSYSLHFLSNSR